MKTFVDLAAELESLHGSDPEADHVEADQILTAALALSAITRTPPTESESNRLIAAFTSVRKWYS